MHQSHTKSSAYNEHYKSKKDSLPNGHHRSPSPHSANHFSVNKSPNSLNRPIASDPLLNQSQNSLNRPLNRSANGHTLGKSHRSNKPLDRSVSSSSNKLLDRALNKHTVSQKPTSRPITKSNNPTTPPTALHKAPAERLLINGFYAYTADLVPKILNCQQNLSVKFEPANSLTNGSHSIGNHQSNASSPVRNSVHSPVAGNQPINGNELNSSQLNRSNRMPGYALVNGQLLTHMQLLANPQLSVSQINLLNYPANAIVHLNQSLEVNASVNAGNSDHQKLPNVPVDCRSNSLNASTNHPNGNVNKPADALKSTERPSSNGSCPIHADSARKSDQNANAFPSIHREQSLQKKADEQPPPNQSQASSQTNPANDHVDGQSQSSASAPTASAGLSTSQATSNSHPIEDSIGESISNPISSSAGNPNDNAVSQQITTKSHAGPEKGRKATTSFHGHYSKEYVKSERDYGRSDYKHDYGKEKRPYLNEFKQRKNKLTKHPNAGAPRSSSTNYTSYGPSYPKLIQNDVVSV